MRVITGSAGATGQCARGKRETSPSTAAPSAPSVLPLSYLFRKHVLCLKKREDRTVLKALWSRRTSGSWACRPSCHLLAILTNLVKSEVPRGPQAGSEALRGAQDALRERPQRSGSDAERRLGAAGWPGRSAVVFDQTRRYCVLRRPFKGKSG